MNQVITSLERSIAMKAANDVNTSTLDIVYAFTFVGIIFNGILVSTI